MASSPPPASPLFLRDAEIRRGVELLFFGNATLMASADALLERAGIGRAHHRALYFIARKPKLSVGELIALLGITKQSLGRVIDELEERELILRSPGLRDRRQVLLSLTERGVRFEAELFAELKSAVARAYSAAGPAAVSGYWAVLEELLPEDLRRRAAQLSLQR